MLIEYKSYTSLSISLLERTVITTLSISEKISHRIIKKNFSNTLPLSFWKIIFLTHSGKILCNFTSRVEVKAEPLISQVLLYLKFASLFPIEEAISSTNMSFLSASCLVLFNPDFALIFFTNPVSNTGKALNLIGLHIFSQFLLWLSATQCSPLDISEPRLTRSFEAVDVDSLLNNCIKTYGSFIKAGSMCNTSRIKALSIGLMSTSTGHEWLIHNFKQSKYQLMELDRIAPFADIIKEEGSKLLPVACGNTENVLDKSEVNIVFNKYLLNLIRLEFKTSPKEGLVQFSLFKIRKSFRQYLRKTDLRSILTSQKYVKLFRNSPDMKAFPFSDIENYVECCCGTFNKLFNTLQEDITRKLYFTETRDGFRGKEDRRKAGKIKESTTSLEGNKLWQYMRGISDMDKSRILDYEPKTDCHKGGHKKPTFNNILLLKESKKCRRRSITIPRIKSYLEISKDIQEVDSSARHKKHQKIKARSVIQAKNDSKRKENNIDCSFTINKANEKDFDKSESKSLTLVLDTEERPEKR